MRLTNSSQRITLATVSEPLILSRSTVFTAVTELCVPEFGEMWGEALLPVLDQFVDAYDPLLFREYFEKVTGHHGTHGGDMRLIINESKIARDRCGRKRTF